MALILLCLLITIYFDAALFKRLDRRLFEEAFRVSAPGAVLGILLILTVLVFSGDIGGDLPPLVLLVLPPFYLLRRGRFTTSMAWEGAHRPRRLLSDALGVIIMWAYGVVVFDFFVSGVMSLFPEAVSRMGELILSAVFSFILIVSLVSRASRNFSDRGFLANVGLRAAGLPRAKTVLLPILIGIFFAFFSSYLTVARQVQPQTPLNEVIETTRSVGLILLFLFLAVGAAPLIEEIVFRGYFFHVIREWLGAGRAVCIIALTFAFLHVGQYWGDWLAIAMVTVLGFTLTVLRVWSRTTVASVIAHYVYNGGVTIIPVVMIAVSNPAYFEYKVYYPHHDAQTKEALLKKSIARQPDLADAYNDLAWLYAEEEKNLDEALELADQALRYAPDYPAYLDTKAEVLEKLGRRAEAQAIRERLKEKLP